MFLRSVFWGVFAAFAVACAAFAGANFPRAVPLVELDLEMDRAAALSGARRLADDLGWEPSAYRQAATFRVDDRVRSFVELEGGGPAAFAGLLEEGPFHPYQWVVRHFRGGEVRAVAVRFRPDGAAYGFRERLSEDAPGGGWRGLAAQRKHTKPTRVRAVADDSDIEVRLRLGPNAYRVIRGRFAAATADTLTVAQDDAEQTFDRQDVLTVRAQRPVLHRPPGWIAFGVLAGTAPALFPSGGDLPFPYARMFVAPPASIPFFLASAWRRSTRHRRWWSKPVPSDGDRSPSIVGDTDLRYTSAAPAVPRQRDPPRTGSADERGT